MLPSVSSEICQQFATSLSSPNSTNDSSNSNDALAIQMPDLDTFVNTPSPSSIASGDNRSERLMENFCSTLKSDQSIKRRPRLDRLFHKSKLSNRKTMSTMTNLLFQMQRELFQLKRRTRRVERLLKEEKNSSKPVIRIARLTKDQISTFCIDETNQRFQRPQKRLINASKTLSSKVWINNRQKPIDFQKYCRLCNREYARRSNYLLHMRTVHKNLEKTGNESDDDNSNSRRRKRGRIAEKIDLRSPSQHQMDSNFVESRQRVTLDETTDDEENQTIEQDEIINLPSLETPLTMKIVESDVYDEPIQFSEDPQKPIYLAVTCLGAPQVDLVNRFLHRFSSRVFESLIIGPRTTHLIANDEGHPLRSPLSMKLIEAIAHHCFCVSIRWISECLKFDRIINESPFEIQGDNTDAQAHGGPQRSRLTLNRYSLFQNISFMIKCRENPEIKMTNSRLEELITTCGGQIITCVTQRLLEQNKILVLCDQQYVTERRNNYEQCRKLGIHFVSSDWVLESVLEYRQKPFVLFEEIPS